MTKYQLKRLIAQARQEGLKNKVKIRLLEYQIKFGDLSVDLSFSIN